MKFAKAVWRVAESVTSAGAAVLALYVPKSSGTKHKVVNVGGYLGGGETYAQRSAMRRRQGTVADQRKRHLAREPAVRKAL